MSGGGAAAGIAAVVILVSMAGGWLFRKWLLRALRERHPRTFAELGQPSTRQLESLLPRHGETQIRFWTYLWGGRVFSIGDKPAARLAVAAMTCDVALAAGVVLLLWSAGR